MENKKKVTRTGRLSQPTKTLPTIFAARYLLYVFPRKIQIFLLSRRTYDALVGVTTHDFFDELSDDDVRRGITIEQRNRMMQTYVRNQYSSHLQEILLTLENEYTDWAETVQLPHMIKEQVRI